MTKHAFDKIMTGAREARAAVPFLTGLEIEDRINVRDRHCRIKRVKAWIGLPRDVVEQPVHVLPHQEVRDPWSVWARPGTGYVNPLTMWTS